MMAWMMDYRSAGLSSVIETFHSYCESKKNQLNAPGFIFVLSPRQNTHFYAQSLADSEPSLTATFRGEPLLG